MQSTMSPETRVKLSMALTTYDRKQSTKRFYNPYALGLYLEALARCEELASKGHDLRLCLLNCFNGKLLDALLKSVGLPLHTKAEAFVGGFERLD